MVKMLWEVKLSELKVSGLHCSIAAIGDCVPIEVHRSQFNWWSSMPSAVTWHGWKNIKWKGEKTSYEVPMSGSLCGSDQWIVIFTANRNRNRFAEPTSVQIGIEIVCELQNLWIGIGIIFVRWEVFAKNSQIPDVFFSLKNFLKISISWLFYIFSHRMPLYFIPVSVRVRLARTLLKRLLSKN